MKKATIFSNVANANVVNYRAVKDAAIAYYEKRTSGSFYCKKKIGIVNWLFEISKLNDHYTLRQKENVVAESGSLDVILTRLFEELRMF
jgi:hypothetical protein